MFWDDIENLEDFGASYAPDDAKNSTNIIAGSGTNNKTAPKRMTEWSMNGRRKAYERVTTDDTILDSIDVPPVSLMNVSTFDVIGQPEVCVLQQQERIKQGVRQRRRRMR